MYPTTLPTHLLDRLASYLGNNRESIGFEKAGIIRANRNVVIGDTDCPKSVLEHASGLNATVNLRDNQFFVQEKEAAVSNDSNQPLWNWKFGEHQVNDLYKPFIPQDNVATALTVLALVENFSFVFNTQNINALIENPTERVSKINRR